MTSFTRNIFSKITTVYKNINSSTLNGAIDIIVVRQEDGTLRCTPFHVRFGKLGVIHSQETKVYIKINDNSVEDLYMQLGEAGEAAFVEEDLNIPLLQPGRYGEPLDGTTFFDSDNGMNSPSETQLENQLSKVDSASTVVNNALIQEQTTSEIIFSNEYQTKPIVNGDLQNGTNNSSVIRRRVRRRVFNRIDYLDKAISEDEDQAFSLQYVSMKRRSRARKRESAPTASQYNRFSISQSVNNGKIPTSIKLLRKRSASETDLPFCRTSLDPEPIVESPPCFHSIESRPKTLSFNRTEENQNGEKLERNTSNPIEIDQSFDSSKTLDDCDPLQSSILSKSMPSVHPTTTSLRHIQSNESNPEFFINSDFSPNSSYESAMSPRPTSPKSDTEYELEKSTQQTTNVGWEWKWGEFPENRSVLDLFWSSSKKKTAREGVYLDEITNNENLDRSMYLPPMDYQQQTTRTNNDEDQELNAKTSIPQSLSREQEVPYTSNDVQISLCGWNPKNSTITDEFFNSHLITYETFSNDPAIVNDPNLVARINGKYYSWKIACAIITSVAIFHKPLSNEIIERMQEKDAASNKSRTTSSGSWWPFYGKKTKTDTPTIGTTTNRSMATAESAKEAKFSKSDNDSELEDIEVRKLLSNSEQEKNKVCLPPAPHPTTTRRKKMILSSDELKRLNLVYGKNKVEFSVTTPWQGTTTIESNIFFFDHMTKFVISDIDGTITRSDVLGHIIPLVGGDWSHDGIADFYNAIQENGYQFIYLSARAIGQSQVTRNLLSNLKQSDRRLPTGPLLISPDTLMTAFYREVIAKKPEDFKIECLKNIASLFPNQNPFYAGFGNRINDQWAYTAVGIPVSRIYTINTRGEIRQKIETLSSSYKNLHEIVDLLFPPMDSFSASESFSVYTYWREEPCVTAFENDIRADLEEIAKRQKPNKSTQKNKNASSSAASTPTTTSIVKTNGHKTVVLAPATENTVKRA